MAKMRIEWVKMDWSTLESMKGDLWNDFICNDDVDEFIAQKICDAVMNTPVSIGTIIDTNEEFFEMKGKLFEEHYCLEKNNSLLLQVENLFRVPVLV